MHRTQGAIGLEKLEKPRINGPPGSLVYFGMMRRLLALVPLLLLTGCSRQPAFVGTWGAKGDAQAGDFQSESYDASIKLNADGSGQWLVKWGQSVWQDLDFTWKQDDGAQTLTLWDVKDRATTGSDGKVFAQCHWAASTDGSQLTLDTPLCPGVEKCILTRRS
jgi:hypothetical protein